MSKTVFRSKVIQVEPSGKSAYGQGQFLGDQKTIILVAF
ncbi:hypothetical protein BRADI_2g54806v3 [Brachypodium distachyon]|uniref:Uncharacterized protein n=1 Tax=Brachypodium distachyon TaxID=15368 RepID=A0A2K2DFX2_BRADI|nr:hypothetical protein BRADI_2g54806v3 [Brachypodium distachyon]